MTASSLGASVIRTVYGLEVAATNDQYIDAFEDGISSAELLLSGTSMLEFFPFLAYLPTWLPGTSLQRRCARYRQVHIRLRDMPWNDAKETIVRILFLPGDTLPPDSDLGMMTHRVRVKLQLVPLRAP